MSNKFLAWCFSFKQKFGMMLRIAASRAPSKSISDIPRTDSMGDALQEGILKSREAVFKNNLSDKQNKTIQAELKAGRPWMAKLRERRYMGTEIQKELTKIIQKDPRLKGMKENDRGPDYTQEGNPVKYELVTDTRSNILWHARHLTLRDELFRYIKLPPK